MTTEGMSQAVPEGGAAAAAAGVSSSSSSSSPSPSSPISALFRRRQESAEHRHPHAYPPIEDDGEDAADADLGSVEEVETR